MATQAEIRARRRHMNQAEMLADMSTSELARNIRRGGIAAKKEQERRDNYVRINAGRSDRLMSDRSPVAIREAAEDREAARNGDLRTQILPDQDLDIGV